MIYLLAHGLFIFSTWGDGLRRSISWRDNSVGDFTQKGFFGCSLRSTQYVRGTCFMQKAFFDCGIRSTQYVRGTHASSRKHYSVAAFDRHDTYVGHAQCFPVLHNSRVVATYQILLGWKACKYYYETDELPNPRPTQTKKKKIKVASGPLFLTENIFSWVGIGFI